MSLRKSPLNHSGCCFCTCHDIFISSYSVNLLIGFLPFLYINCRKLFLLNSQRGKSFANARYKGQVRFCLCYIHQAVGGEWGGVKKIQLFLLINLIWKDSYSPLSKSWQSPFSVSLCAPTLIMCESKKDPTVVQILPSLLSFQWTPDPWQAYNVLVLLKWKSQKEKESK